MPLWSSWTQMKQLDLSSVGQSEILIWAKLSNNSVSAGRHQPKQANEHSEPVPANRGSSVSQANYAAKINLSRGVVLRGTCLPRFSSSLPPCSCFLMREFGCAGQTYLFFFFSLSHFPSSPSYLVAFSFFSDSLLSKQPLGNEQWHLQDRI